MRLVRATNAYRCSTLLQFMPMILLAFFLLPVFTEIHLSRFTFQFCLSFLTLCTFRQHTFLPSSQCSLAPICTTFLCKNSVSSCLLIRVPAKHISQKRWILLLWSPGIRLFYLFCQLFWGLPVHPRLNLTSTSSSSACTWLRYPSEHPPIRSLNTYIQKLLLTTSPTPNLDFLCPDLLQQIWGGWSPLWVQRSVIVKFYSAVWRKLHLLPFPDQLVCSSCCWPIGCIFFHICLNLFLARSRQYLGLHVLDPHYL